METQHAILTVKDPAEGEHGLAFLRVLEKGVVRYRPFRMVQHVTRQEAGTADIVDVVEFLG